MSSGLTKLETKPSVFNLLAKGFKWNLNRDLLVAFASYILVVSGLWLAFQVFTTNRVAANFITFGPVTLAGLGVALPALYTVLVRRRPLSDLGVTLEGLLPSLLLGLVLGWDTYRNTLVTLDVPWGRQIIPLLSMALAVGLFEAVFFRGWLQLCFEETFGLVPSILLGAACYSLYHIGYGMGTEEVLFLFGLGLTFAAMFRLTKNILVLWPFYTPVGGLYTNFKDGLALPFEATYGFLITIAIMIAILIFSAISFRKLKNKEE